VPASVLRQAIRREGLNSQSRSVRELNDALFWVTIKGAPEKIEAQIWLSAFGVDETKLNNFEKSWSQRRSEILS